MAEQREVWEEIRDALHRLVEEEARQTALLEEMLEEIAEKQWRRDVISRTAVYTSAMAGMVALYAFTFSLIFTYEVGVWWLRVLGVTLMLGLVTPLAMMWRAFIRGPRRRTRRQ